MSDIHKNESTILIVDDQPNIIKILSNLLNDEYRILAVKEGKKAIEIATGNNQPDLILLDVGMPDINGYEVCRILKSNELSNKIPVIFITARDESEEEEKGFLLGASDYIKKPFHPAVVRARIKNQIQLKKYMNILEDRVYEDALTGIANRRIYDEMFQKIWKQCAREKKYISLIMFDIDHFKAYNDHYGHGSGDECLRKVAQALKKHVNRPLDVIARYGGEEFTVILYDTDINETKTIAEKMCQQVRELNIPHDYSLAAPFVTVSAGYAATIPSHTKKPDKLLQHADMVLYAAKSAGKNQCIAWKNTK
jgi:diguanylate cyclase (GGDEF)-like protein